MRSLADCPETLPGIEFGPCAAPVDGVTSIWTREQAVALFGTLRGYALWDQLERRPALRVFGMEEPKS